MSVWLCIPSKRPAEEALERLRKWKERGYRIAICADTKQEAEALDEVANCLMSPPDGVYRGYARSTNALIGLVSTASPDADWFVIGGDDVEPDLNHTAEEIAASCNAYFGTLGWPADRLGPIEHATFGVMQPTGDRWGENPKHPDPAMRSAYIDRVCGSAWLGREFCERAYGGNGPLWPEYTHMGVDEELQEVAIMLGCLWQRRDLIQQHQHWGRPQPGETLGQRYRMPEFLEQANSAAHWKAYRDLIKRRREAGFPGAAVKV